ncbi:hypothetical protein GCM10025771_01260 [Niveibacterium umoris]|uniref:Phosphate ABC transporter substrate-binding protein n=1 Tax=Niveibacterium umoris TaxID=1193620 RepID=A0A840BL93_9RHOO|nr:hypothetical protein [Niveibacterium umoris]MBB4014331.1 hypothetical protein [Niveibacterium umoris]
MTRFRSLLLTLLFAGEAWAGDLVVISNPAAGIERLRREDVINLYMGRFRQLPSGIAATPVDLAQEAGPQKQQFYERLVGRDLAEIRAYWSRLTFSGQASPPMQVGSEAQVLDVVASRVGAVGYVHRRAVDARVHIVYELGDPGAATPHTP